MNCEHSEPKLPGNMVTVEGYCQKKWLLHYGYCTILGVQNPPSSMLMLKVCASGGSGPLSPGTARGCEAFWTNIVYHYDPCMGERLYTVGFS